MKKTPLQIEYVFYLKLLQHELHTKHLCICHKYAMCAIVCMQTNRFILFQVCSVMVLFNKWYFSLLSISHMVQIMFCCDQFAWMVSRGFRVEQTFVKNGRIRSGEVKFSRFWYQKIVCVQKVSLILTTSVVSVVHRPEIAPHYDFQERWAQTHTQPSLGRLAQEFCPGPYLRQEQQQQKTINSFRLFSPNRFTATCALWCVRSCRWCPSSEDCRSSSSTSRSVPNPRQNDPISKQHCHFFISHNISRKILRNLKKKVNVRWDFSEPPGCSKTKGKPENCLEIRGPDLLTHQWLDFQTVDFDLTNTANMLDVPLLSNTVRGIIVDQLSYYMVLPNKLPVQLAQGIDMTAFKYPQPAVSFILFLGLCSGVYIRPLQMGEIRNSNFGNGAIHNTAG